MGDSGKSATTLVMVSETEDLELKEQVKVDRVALQRLKKQDEFRTSLDTRERGWGWQGEGWRGGWGGGGVQVQ